MEGDPLSPSDLPPKRHDWLPRLTPAAYRGFAAVHWQMTIDRRRQGWLTAEFHLRFREVLLHTLSRHDLISPIYCLMPDHMHLLWMGISHDSDQKNAARFFRRHVNTLLDQSLTGTRFQQQAYDRVLRQSDTGPDAVRDLAHYIQQNPVRAKWVQRPQDWPYLGSMIPGYPSLHPLDDDFWTRFWKIRSQQISNTQTPPP